MLIPRTLPFGPVHGHQIAKHIQRATDDVLHVDVARSIPLCIAWSERVGLSPSSRWPRKPKREFKYYRVTAAGRKQLASEESKWKQLTGAIGQVMWPVRMAMGASRANVQWLVLKQSAATASI